MPIFVPRYAPEYSRLASIYAQTGDTLARLALQRGVTTSEGLARLASILSGGINTVREGRLRQEATALRSREREDDRKEREAERRAAAEERKATRDYQQRQDERAAARYAVDTAAPGPQSQALLRIAQQFPELAARFRVEQPLDARGVGGAPDPEQGGSYPVLEPTAEQAERAGTRQLQRERWAAEDAARKADDVRADAALRQQTTYQNASLALQREARAAAEKPSIWVSKGSDMRFVTPTQAAQMSAEGWRSGSTREQGRPVISGDANRIADFDTSLDDLKVLRSTVAPRDVKTGNLIEPGATGTAAKLGAIVPNWMTEWTGIGATAKSKQGVIDRVKQVIGKALEGGVLRKEDEYKYTKILPTIGDPVEIVESKLNDLESAIKLRRQTLLDSLSDAGYDVTRYNERPGGVTVLSIVPVPRSQ